MNITNPAIVAALERAAYIANVTPSDVVEHFLEHLVSDLQNDSIGVLGLLVGSFRHEDRAAAEVAAERLAEFAADEHIEGRTEFTVACEVVEGGDGYEVLVEHLHPKRGKWEPALPPPAGEDEDDNENGADWWKQSS
jgi:hypothetical protein